MPRERYVVQITEIKYYHAPLVGCTMLPAVNSDGSHNFLLLVRIGKTKTDVWKE